MTSIWKHLRRGAACLGALALGASLFVGPVRADYDDDDDARPYAIGLWGDLPYSVAQETTGLPNLLADMNKADLKFTVYDGDLKQGSNSACDDALYGRALGWFNSLNGAAMFTPGDNDWVDCDRPSNGGYNSLERLDFERKTFFNTYFSQGKRPIRQDVQTDKICLGYTDPKVACVENRRWTLGRVTYVTVNVQGSCNNLCDTFPNSDEYAARNAANIAWLKESFQVAKDRRSVAVMIISQADPGFDLSDGTRAPLRDPKTLVETDGQPDGFAKWLQAVRDETIAFRRPVAYVHGDSHYQRVDKPLLDTLGRRLENFTRVETFGDNAANGNNDVNWLKVVVDPNSREVFYYQPVIVPANRVAVPPPANDRR